MNFRHISIDDKERIEKYLKAANLMITEHCFTTIFMWQDHYCTEFYEDGEFLFLKSCSMPEKKEHYICPIGTGDLKKAIDKLYTTFGLGIEIVSVTEEQKQKLEHFYPGLVHFEELRDSADYIYLAERLISLSGKKLQAKRNFVNRFIKDYGDTFRFETMTSVNKIDAWNFHQTWSKESDSEDEMKSLQAETGAIKRLIDNFESLGIMGGLLYVGNTLAGFTIGTKSTDDVAVIHIEKCDTTFTGAYQMINKSFAETHLADVTYINREEDMGIEGLRKAKLSYKPEIILMKYSVTRKDA